MFPRSVILLILAGAAQLGLFACSGAATAASSVPDIAESDDVIASVSSLEADADRALARGEWADAARVYDLLIESGESSPRTVIHRAACDLGLNDFDAARARLLSLVESTSLDEPASELAWNIVTRAGGCTECLASPNCGGDTPGSDTLRVLGANCALQLGELDRAAQLLAADLSTVEAIIASGLLSWLQGSPEDALRLFERALNVAPNNLDALRNAGIVAHELGRAEPARTYLSRYVAAAPPRSSDAARVRAILNDLQ